VISMKSLSRHQKFTDPNEPFVRGSDCEGEELPTALVC